MGTGKQASRKRLHAKKKGYKRSLALKRRADDVDQCQDAIAAASASASAEMEEEGGARKEEEQEEGAEALPHALTAVHGRTVIRVGAGSAIGGAHAARVQTEWDDDLPGGGQFYCMACARHFTDERALRTHVLSKPHKKRLKIVAEEKYTQEEADRGRGMTKEVLPPAHPATTER